jgi:hypothetical protein
MFSPRKEDNSLELLILLILFLVLALAAWRWGFDSRDGPLSPEWERRRWHDVDRQRRNEKRDGHPSQLQVDTKPYDAGQGWAVLVTEKVRRET